MTYLATPGVFLNISNEMDKVLLCTIENDITVGAKKGHILKSISIYNYWHLCSNGRRKSYSLPHRIPLERGGKKNQISLENQATFSNSLSFPVGLKFP